MYKFIVLLLLCYPTLEINAETPEEKGLAIALEADKRDTGWQDSTAELQMILRNAHGQESHRKMRIKSLEVENDGDKSLSIFDTPKDVKGTAFLSFTHAVDADDQWLYLPALKRVKRISSSNKSGPFVGSEFAFEDLTSPEIKKYRYKWLRDESIGGREAYVVEHIPVYKHSGYKSLIVWLDKDIYRPLKIEYFDRKGSLLKTLSCMEYKKYSNDYWRPSKMTIVNHQSKKSTDLLWEGYKFNLGLSMRDFDKNALKRSR